MNDKYVSVTEISGDDVTQEQVERLCHRYYWAKDFCKDRDVVEVACGTGQGVGYLKGISASFEAGDYSSEILRIARLHYADRFQFQQFDAQDLPFESNSLDVVIIYEAIYYIPDARKFVQECVRVLRPGGKVLVATANKDLFDFNPSPHSFKYYGVVELVNLFKEEGFAPNCYGYMAIGSDGLKQNILRFLKQIVVSLNLMPKTMGGKKLLKRLVFGGMVKMPEEISSNMFPYDDPVPLDATVPATSHKVIYCVAELK